MNFKRATDNYIDLILGWPKLVVSLSLLLIFLLGLSLPSIKLTADLRTYFSDDNPQLIAFNNLENTFSKQDSLDFFVLDGKGDVFNKQTLRLIRELTDEGWKIPYSQRVDSLANYQHTVAEGDDITSESLIGELFGYSEAEIDRVKKIALSEPKIIDHLLSSSGKGAGVSVSVILPQDDLEAANNVVKYAHKVIDRLDEKYPNATIYLTGSTAVNAAFGEAVERDITTFVGLSYIIILVGLVVLVRSFSGTLITLIMIGFAVVGAFGVVGWTGIVLTPSIGLVPTIIMTITVADAIHILVSYYHQLGEGDNKIEAIRASLRVNTGPVFITSLSTALGFLTLNFNESPPFRDMGNIVAVGVTLAYLLSMLFLPACLALLPEGKKRKEIQLTSVMSWLAEWVIRFRFSLLITTSAFVLILATFVPNNEMVENWNDQFDETFKIRNALDTVNDHLGGAHHIQYLLDSGRSGGIDDPEYLKSVEAFANWYKMQPDVTYVDNVTDIVKGINKNMHGDDENYRKLPDNQQLISQYMLLYELTLPLGLGLDSTINIDRSATRFIVATKKSDSKKLIKLDENAQEWLKQNATNIKPTSGTGIDMVVSLAQQRNIESVIKTAVIALILISFVLVISLGSLRLGLISLVPNLAPAAIAYGLWGVFVGEINMAGALVICMSLGIVVDDTVHFMSKYRVARNDLGLTREDGVRYAFKSVGVALLVTSAVLVLGFLVTIGSNFQPTIYTGALMSMTLLFALIVDFLMLPPLLMYFDKK
jgi:predicted RND superfamily exporter protein